MAGLRIAFFFGVIVTGSSHQLADFRYCWVGVKESAEATLEVEVAFGV
jgi:hypothetical protein